MAIVTDFTGSWSSAVTLAAAEFWQVQVGPVYIATAATTAPSDLADGLLLGEGDTVSFASGEVVRYRSARPDGGGRVMRRARA